MNCVSTGIVLFITNWKWYSSKCEKMTCLESSGCVEDQVFECLSQWNFVSTTEN